MLLVQRQFGLEKPEEWAIAPQLGILIVISITSRGKA